MSIAELSSGDYITQLEALIASLKEGPAQIEVLKLFARTLEEMSAAALIFGQHPDRRKISIFGSARTREHDPEFQQAVEIGRKITDHGFLVITGAGGGIMEAGHIGAGADNSFGINILLPFEQAANSVISKTERLASMKYFFTRKVMFVRESDGFVCLPGGFGTLDETTEVLTLLQTGKTEPVPVVLLDEPGGTYWKGFDDFVREKLLAKELISPEDLHLYRITDSVDEAVEEVVGFYRVYSSMRYINGKVVFRLEQGLSNALLDYINEQFTDILVDGQFSLQRHPLPEEGDEEPGKPRLTFAFNRKNFGRLRQLINRINQGLPQ